jgi:hypothetical protein
LKHFTHRSPAPGSPRADWDEDDNKPAISRIPRPRRPLDVATGLRLDAVGAATRAEARRG